MQELIYYVASTLDGFIAHEDGSYDGFLWDEAYGAALSAAFPETIPAHCRDWEHTASDNNWFDTLLMGKALWLGGGGALAGTLLAAGLIDKLIVKLNPVFFGGGIPMFAGEVKRADLELTEQRPFDNGVVLLHYRLRSCD